MENLSIKAPFTPDQFIGSQIIFTEKLFSSNLLDSITPPYIKSTIGADSILAFDISQEPNGFVPTQLSFENGLMVGPFGNPFPEPTTFVTFNKIQVYKIFLKDNVIMTTLGASFSL